MGMSKSITLNNWVGGVNTFVDTATLPRYENQTLYRNVYTDLSNTIKPTRRNMGHDGLWFFDGQFYSLRHPRYWYKDSEELD